MAHDVFISYASEDKPVADAMCATLESREIRCWIAPRDILPGKPYPEAIEEAVAASRLMVVVLSQPAADSRDVRSEIHLAFRLELLIVPFRIQETHLIKGMDYWLGAVHWLDAMTSPLELHLLTLAKRVREHLGPSLQTPPPKPDRSSNPEANACHDRGAAHYHRKEFAEAIADLTRAIELDPTVAWAFNDRGAAYLQQGELAAALNDLNEGIRLDPTRAWAFHTRGGAHTRLGDSEAAIRDYTQAIHLDPAIAWFFHDRGAAQLSLQEYPLAVEDFTQAILLNPNLEWAYRNRATSYENLGRHDLAQADREMAEKLSSGKV